MPHSPGSDSIADDPELAALALQFVANLPARMRAIEAQHAAGQLPELARLAHKLVGAASCYQLDDVAVAARRVEDLAKAGDAVDDLAAATSTLAELCARHAADAG